MALSAPPSESDATAEDALNSVEDRQWVKQMLLSLPTVQRQVMALFLDGLSVQEISESLAKTPENIRQNLRHARQHLKEFTNSSIPDGTDTKPTSRRVGRPPSCPPELALRIIELRGRGLSYAQVADVLNANHIPTPMGGSHWMKSHVDRLLHTRFVQELINEEALSLASGFHPC